MNGAYFLRLQSLDNNSNIKVATPGPNLTIKPNYFHLNPNSQQYRMGDDLTTLQQARTWYDFHQVTGEIFGQPCTTIVGLTPIEYKKVLAHVSGVPTRIEVDLLEDTVAVQHHPLEVFIENSRDIKIFGTTYSMKIDFNSGNFHQSWIWIGAIGERFSVELL